MTTLSVLLRNYSKEELVDILYRSIVSGETADLYNIDTHDPEEEGNQKAIAKVLAEGIINPMTRKHKNELDDIFDTIVKKLIADNHVHFHVTSVPSKLNKAYLAAPIKEMGGNNLEHLKIKASSIIIDGTNHKASDWGGVRLIYSIPEELRSDINESIDIEDLDRRFRRMAPVFFPVDANTNIQFNKETGSFPIREDEEEGPLIDAGKIISENKEFHASAAAIVTRLVRRATMITAMITAISSYAIMIGFDMVASKVTDKDFDPAKSSTIYAPTSLFWGAVTHQIVKRILKPIAARKNYLAHDGISHTSISNAVKGELIKHFVNSLEENKKLASCDKPFSLYKNSRGKLICAFRSCLLSVSCGSYDDTVDGIEPFNVSNFSEALFAPSETRLGEILLARNGKDPISIESMKNELLDNCKHHSSAFDALLIGILSSQSQKQNYSPNDLPNIYYVDANKKTLDKKELKEEEKSKIKGFITQYNDLADILKNPNNWNQESNEEKISKFFDKFNKQESASISILGLMISDLYYELTREGKVDEWLDSFIRHKYNHGISSVDQELDHIEKIINNTYGTYQAEQFGSMSKEKVIYIKAEITTGNQREVPRWPLPTLSRESIVGRESIVDIDRYKTPTPSPLMVGRRVDGESHSTGCSVEYIESQNSHQKNSWVQKCCCPSNPEQQLTCTI